MTRPPSDQHVRQQALNPTLSFAVQAPAGSGKTELLTQRILSLLACCDQPESILAITFTRKSAAEMRQRIQESLRLGLSPQEPSEAHQKLTWSLARNVLRRDQEKQWKIRENPNRLRIQTIDGFCRSLAGQQPVSSQLGALPETLDSNVETQKLMLDAIQNTLNELEHNTPLSASIEYVLSHVDNNIPHLENLLLQLLLKRDQWLFHHHELIDEKQIQLNNRLLIEEMLSKARGSLKIQSENIIRYFNHAAGHHADYGLPLDTLPLADVHAIPDWRRLLKFLTKKDGGIRSPGGINVSMGIPADSPLKKEVKQFFADLGEDETIIRQITWLSYLPEYPIKSDTIALFKHIHILLRRCIAHLKLKFRQHLATDYAEIAIAALDALGTDENPTDLALKLDYKIQHILVDEFQDTSHLQWRLLEKLTAGWQIEDGHSIFIVGDPMQSCYQFRNADVRIFLRAMSKGIGSIPLIKLQLTENFRSEAGIVSWNNRTFSKSFPPQEDINECAVPYHASAPFKGEGDPLPVQCFISSNPQDELSESDDLDRQITQKIIRLIETVRHQNPQETIAILVRNRRHADNIFPSLKKAGIPWQAKDMYVLNHHMAVLDLLTLTRCILYPADHLAWLSLLRSPLAGLSLRDLHCLCNPTSDDEASNRPPTLLSQLIENKYSSDLTPEGHQILNRISPHITQAWREQQRKPLRIWIEGLWYALGGPATVNPLELKSCGDFFSALEKHEYAGVISDWPLFEAAIDQLYGKEEVSSENPVQIMTLHKSKGLEFDHVFLPSLDSKPRHEDAELILWSEYFLDDRHDPLLLLAAKAEIGEDHDQNYAFINKLRRRKTEHESLRLLYVGCTRAIKKLYLFASISTKDGELKTPSQNSLLSPIWDSFQKTAQVLPWDTSPDTQQSSSHSLEHIRRFPADWQPPDFPTGNILTNYRGKERNTLLNIPESTSLENFIARQMGIVVHRYLQYFAEQGLDYWQPSKVSESRSDWIKMLRQQGLGRHLIEKSCDQIEKILRQTLQSPTGRWILSPHTEGSCETAFFFQNRQFMIDRTFVEGDTRWIIDYKTSPLPAGLNQQDFIQHQMEKYRPQLNHYRLIMEKRDKRTIKTALYFPLMDHFSIMDDA